MPEKVFLIHGWSVKETTTYQALHLQLAKHGYDLHEIFPGRYVSLDDEVEIGDISQAMHNELKRHLGKSQWNKPFHMITHSTGALVVKDWVVDHYQGKFIAGKPLKNIVFLAGPHFGSRLAHHGRSMLAHAKYHGDTGNKILTSLELGSDFSWDSNKQWLDFSQWRGKGIKPFCLIGDRVERNFFASKIFPAGYEDGSDMVVRVPAANLNFRRFQLNGATGKIKKVGEISGVPFAAMADYVHSGDKHGIMNNITKNAAPNSTEYLNLKTILQCLRVKTSADYDLARRGLAAITRKTRSKRKPFAQLDFRFRDQTGAPIDDFKFILGVIDKGKEKPSKMVKHLHKNKIAGNHLTVFLDLQELKTQRKYFMDFNSDSGTELFSYKPDPYHVEVTGNRLSSLISADQTTQIDVILAREPHRNLFVFHHGDDPDLHVKWNRKGEITKKNIAPK